MDNKKSKAIKANSKKRALSWVLASGLAFLPSFVGEDPALAANDLSIFGGGGGGGGGGDSSKGGGGGGGGTVLYEGTTYQAQGGTAGTEYAYAGGGVETITSANIAGGSLSAGAGGNGGNVGGAGSNGSDSSLTTTGSLAVNNVEISGGGGGGAAEHGGGGGGGGAAGGNGANGTYYGGAGGGAGGQGSAATYAGGQGGAAGLVVEGTLTVQGEMNIQSGESGISNPDAMRGMGGATSIRIKILKADDGVNSTGTAYTFAKRGGDFDMAVDEFWVNRDVTLKIDKIGNTGAGDSLQFNKLSIDAGKKLSLTSTDAQSRNFNIFALQAGGPGAQLIGNGTDFNNSIVLSTEPGGGGSQARYSQLSFYLTEAMQHSDTILTITQNGNLKLDTLDPNSNAGVVIEHGRKLNNLKEGDTITLLVMDSAGTGKLTDYSSWEAKTILSSSGSEFILDVEDNSITAYISKLIFKTLDPQRFKALAQARLGNFVLLDQSGHLIYGPGMQSMLGNSTGLAVIAGVTGGSTRAETGSHVDVDGFSVIAGLGWNTIFENSFLHRLAAGAFVEAGYGSYDTYSSFSNAPSVSGDGDSRYAGVGVMGRLDWQNGLYAEASLRTGRVSVDYESKKVVPGEKTEMDSTVWYQGAHAGLGYQIDLEENLNLDLYGRLFWTRQAGDSLHTNGAKVQFDSANSIRHSLGARLSYQANEYVTPYAGLAWQHEYNAKQKSKVDGQRIKGPELKGSNAMLEAGLSIKPAPGSGFSLDLGAQGYLGRREGISGNISVKYEF